MNGGFQFFDIILFAMIAVFLILRLRNVLGRRDGTDGDHRDPFKGGRNGPTQPRPKNGAANQNDATDATDVTDAADHADNVVHLPGRDQGGAADQDVFGAQDPAEPNRAADTPIQRGVRAIMDRDADFDPDGFIGGAQAAFEMILGAFGQGDKNTLQPLLSPEVFDDFAGAIDARAIAEETADNTLVAIKEIEFTEAGLDGSVANVTLRFVSEQVLVIHDKDGQVVDGDPNFVSTVTDIWTFSRDTRSHDPNWALVATGASD